MTDQLRIDRDDRGVVTLTMDRPEVRNAFGPDLIGALADALADLAQDDTVRVLVLTGAGKVFSAGADLNWMRSMVDYSREEQIADSHQLDGLMHSLDTFPAPVVARVNGHAIAGATGLIASSDIVVAVAPAKFGFTEARLGLVPAVISTYVLPRIGTTAARRWFLSGELFDAAEAHRIGLVHQVCDPDDLDATVAQVVDGLLAAAPGAQRMVKKMIRDVATMHRDTARVRMVELIAQARNAPEGQAGMQAFLDGDDPPWSQG